MQAMSSRGSAWRGALTGLVPLGLLAGLLAVSVGATALARQMSFSSGFFFERQVVLIVLVAGLGVAVVVYAGTCVWVLRRVGAWQRAGDARRAAGALWALGITAVVVVAPVVVAVLLPQHPAP